MPPLAWYDVLWELARSQDGMLRPYEIEERTLLAQYNLSRLIDRLEKESLVRREAFAEDGRGRWVVITDAGRKTSRAHMDGLCQIDRDPYWLQACRKRSECDRRPARPLPLNPVLN
ncbi:DNA-binding MarR family transcriptional regulator [Rhizobium brockwellii]